MRQTTKGWFSFALIVAVLVYSGCEGPVGPIGSVGPQGPQGVKGDKGDKGPAGLQGETGPEGPAGPQGETGPEGPAGPQGETGPEGPAGPQGETGPEGPAGPQGETSAADPPFPSTIWITPDIIDENDPSSLLSVTYVGRGERDFWNDAERWITIHAYLFDVQYPGRKIEFQVHPELGSVEAAEEIVTIHSVELGRLPAVLLLGLNEVEIGTENGVSANIEGGISIEVGDGEHALEPGGRDYGFWQEVLMHETGHASLDKNHDNTADWRRAQVFDGTCISDYGCNFPGREDLTESFTAWFAVRYRPERLEESVRDAFLVTIPNRLDYFDKQGFDMSPYRLPSDHGNIAQPVP